MQLCVFQCDDGYALAEPGVRGASLATQRYGASPRLIAMLQSIQLPVAASIELIDAVSRNTVAFRSFAQARALGLESLIQLDRVSPGPR